MNKAPDEIAEMLASRLFDFIPCVEFYDRDYVPDSLIGWNPSDALAIFSTETVDFTFNAPVSVETVSYAKEMFSVPAVSRNIGKQTNSLTVRMSNIPKEATPAVRPLAAFVLNYHVEGLQLIFRVLSRQLLNVPMRLDLVSFVGFVGRCGPDEGFDVGSGTITASQHLGTPKVQVPSKTFEKSCPLRFKGTECLGRLPLGSHTAEYQAGTECDHTQAMCDFYGNLENRQGINVYQIQGSFKHRRHHGFFRKLFHILVPVTLLLHKKKLTTVGSSLNDGTPYGKAWPEVFGRWQLPGIPLQYKDIGTAIDWLMAWCRGPISAILNIRTTSANFDQPIMLVNHYGRFGGEADQAADAVFPSHGFYSRLAYSTGRCGGSDIEVEDAAPEMSAMIAGRAATYMTTSHFMNRCGSGRIGSGGLGYGILADRWTDNPADQVRIMLQDEGLFNINPSRIEVRRSFVSAMWCTGGIMDETNGERLLLPNEQNPLNPAEAAKAGVDFKRYHSTGLITGGCWPIATILFPSSRVDREAKYEYFDQATPPAPGSVPVKTFFRKRWTSNVALTEQKSAMDFMSDILLWTFKGYLTWNWLGQVAIRCEMPADETVVRADVDPGDDVVQLQDASFYIEDINENGFGLNKIGQILIGVGLDTSEVRRVVAAEYSSAAANLITLDAFGTGGTVATPSGPTLSGGGPFTPSSGTIQITGTIAEGDTVTAVIDGISVTFEIQAGMLDGGLLSPGTTVASALAFAINSHPQLRQFVVANDDGWWDFLTVSSKLGQVTLESPLQEAHAAGEDTMRVMDSFSDQAQTWANVTRANAFGMKYLGTDGQTRYNQFSGKFFSPLHDFAEQSVEVNDEAHQIEVSFKEPMEVDVSAADNYNQASRRMNAAAAKYGDGMRFFTWGSNGLALQYEEGDRVCYSDRGGEFRNVPVTIEKVDWNDKFQAIFKARIYSKTMNDDVSAPTDIDIPSLLDNWMGAPPTPASNTLAQVGTYGVNGTYDTKITGVVATGAFVYGQKFNVYVTPPGGAEGLVLTGLRPDSSGLVHYEIPAPIPGLYSIRVQAISMQGVPGGSITEDITVGNLVQTIQPPTNVVADVVDGRATVKWDPAATFPERATGYIVYAVDGTTVLMPKAKTFFWPDPRAAGSYTVKVAAADDMGNQSSLVSVAYVSTTSAGGAGMVVKDEGTPLASRPFLNFVGAGVTATDDGPGTQTVVTIPGVTAELVQDIVGPFLTDGDVDWEYDDPGNAIANVVKRASKSFALTGDISPAQLTSDVNDWNPAGLADASGIRVDTNGNWSMTGLAGGSDGRVVIIHYVGSFTLKLPSEHAGSTAANRLALNADITLGPNQSAPLQYDATSARWRSLSAPSSGSSGATSAGGPLQRTFTFKFDGRGDEIDPVTIKEGVLAFSPVSGTLVEVYIKDPDGVVGDCTFDLRAAPRGSAPPDGSDSLVGGGTAPELAAGSEAIITDFSDWDTDHLDAFDEVRLVVLTNTNHEALDVVLTIRPDNDIRVITLELDGRGSVIDPLTVKQAVQPFSPYSGTVVEAYIKDLDDVAGTCEIDVRARPRTSSPPTGSDSLVGAGTPPSTTASAEGLLAVTDWDQPHIDFGDEVRAVMVSNTLHEHVVIVLSIFPD